VVGLGGHVLAHKLARGLGAKEAFGGHKTDFVPGSLWSWRGCLTAKVLDLSYRYSTRFFMSAA
jgi:hypothetical protein